MVHTIPGTKLLLHDSKHSICGILSQQTGTQNKCRHLCRAVLLKQIKHSVGKAGKSWAEQHATWGLVQMEQALVQVCHKSLQTDQTLLVSYTTTSSLPSVETPMGTAKQITEHKLIVILTILKKQVPERFPII
jgi:hypothetical protein